MPSDRAGCRCAGSFPMNVTGMTGRRLKLLWAALLLAVLATYSNHFENGFHFDDWHTIVQNPYIRDLKHIPAFFTDTRTHTVHPPNQIYRPLVSTMLAIDYWAAGGLDTTWYHVDVFVFYVALLVAMWRMFVMVLRRARAGPHSEYVALFAVAWYGLHPVSAETVNYLYQRGDLYATLGVVTGVAMYAAGPAWRRWGLYLAPVLLGLFAKQSALMFAPLLLVYVLLFEAGLDPAYGARGTWRESARRSLPIAARASAPAFALCAAYYVFQRSMAPAWSGGAASALQYWMTQPVVLLHYFTSLFLPIGLTADTDRQLVTSALSPAFLGGAAFLIAVVYAAWRLSWRAETRPAAFGLAWFLLASVPTSVLPLAEPENDHRMFFPFVGLILAVCWCAFLLLQGATRRRAPSRGARAAFGGILLALLVAFAYGAHARNEVWRSEETLWKDVTVKSPRNGRGLMNYGLQLMRRGDYHGALRYFDDALRYVPNYSYLHVNLGIANAGIGRDDVAEQHFRRALTATPGGAVPYFHYASHLKAKGRLAEAAALLQTALEMNRDHMDSRHLLMAIRQERGDVAGVKQLAEETLRLFPKDPKSAAYAAWAGAGGSDRVLAAEVKARQQRSPEALLELSLAYALAGRHEDSIAAARQALELRPGYAAAYNNIAAAHQAMERWDDAIAAAEEALRFQPDFPLARNNLAYATRKKNLAAGQH